MKIQLLKVARFEDASAVMSILSGYLSKPHLPCYSLSIILSVIPLLIILPSSVIYDMVVAR
uniref:Putative ovule protein n=1 Tax=Solanum chacoense TaxID=4108 RepID=A0A0V0H1D3_SOLCH